MDNGLTRLLALRILRSFIGVGLTLVSDTELTYLSGNRVAPYAEQTCRLDAPAGGMRKGFGNQRLLEIPGEALHYVGLAFRKPSIKWSRLGDVRHHPHTMTTGLQPNRRFC